MADSPKLSTAITPLGLIWWRCVNDVLTAWGRTVFLDYLATGKLNPEQLTQVVAGISQGCQMAECALLGERRQKCLFFYQVVSMTWLDFV